MVNGANLRLQKIREIQHRLNSQRASLSADSFRGGIENRRRKLAAAQKSIDDQIRGLAQEKFFIKRGRHAGSRSTGSVRSITDIPGFEGGIGARILADAKGTEDIRTGRRKVVREDASRTLAVTRPTSSGGKITVTRAGKVTERSKEGIVVGRGKITPLRARKFLSKEGAVVQSKIEFDRAQKEAGQSFAIPNQSFLRNISLTEGGEGAVIFEPEKIARPNQSVDFSQAKSSLPPKNSFRADAAEKNLEGVKKVIKRFTVTVRRATSQYRRLVKENTAFEINKLILTKKLFNLGFKVGTDYTGAFARGLGNLFEIHDLAKDVDVTRSVLQSIKLRETLSEIEQLNKKLIKKQKVQSLPLFELMKAQERKEIEKLIKIYVFRSEKLRAKNSPVIKRFKQLLLAPDTIFFLSTVGLLAGGAALPSLIGKVGTAVLFESIGAVQTTIQGLRTLKEPSKENVALLLFFALPTTLVVLKKVGSVKRNLRISSSSPSKFLNRIEELRKTKNRNLLSRKKILEVHLDQAINEIAYLKNNPGLVRLSKKYNPLVYNKEFRNLLTSYRTSIHRGLKGAAGSLKSKKSVLVLNSAEKSAFRRALVKTRNKAFSLKDAGRSSFFATEFSFFSRSFLKSLPPRLRGQYKISSSSILRRKGSVVIVEKATFRSLRRLKSAASKKTSIFEVLDSEQVKLTRKDVLKLSKEADLLGKGVINAESNINLVRKGTVFILVSKNKTYYFTDKRKYLKALFAGAKEEQFFIKGGGDLVSNLVSIGRRNRRFLRSLGSKRRVSIAKERVVLRRLQRKIAGGTPLQKIVPSGRIVGSRDLRSFRPGVYVDFDLASLSLRKRLKNSVSLSRGKTRVYELFDEELGHSIFFTSVKAWKSALKKLVKLTTPKKDPTSSLFFLELAFENKKAKFSFTVPKSISPKINKEFKVYTKKTISKVQEVDRDLGAASGSNQKLVLLKRSKSQIQKLNKQSEVVRSEGRRLSLRVQKQRKVSSSLASPLLLIKRSPLQQNKIKLRIGDSAFKSLSLIGLKFLFLSKLKSSLSFLSLSAKKLSKGSKKLQKKVVASKSAVLSIPALRKASRSVLKRTARKKLKQVLISKKVEVLKKINFEKKKEKKLRRLVSFSLRKKKFIYLPDLYSLIFGVKANKSERAAFLKMGRVFTGLEGRKLVR